MKTKFGIILAGVLVGFVGVITKHLTPDINPVAITFFRLLFASIFLAILMPVLDKKAYKIKRKDLPNYISIGMLKALALGSFIYALSYAPVSNVVLLSSFSVVFVTIFAYIFLREKLKFNQKLAIIVALIGLLVINPFNFKSGFFIGNMISLSNALFYALLLVFLRSEEKTHSIGSIMWFFFFATLFYVPFIFMFGLGNNILTHLPLLIVLGVFCTALPFLLIGYGAKRLHADTISIISLLVTPIASIALAILIINEALNFRILLGGTILILAGVVLHYIRKRHIRKITKQLHLHLHA
jgi:drug/metabolite transporter (DMT)-like permease